VTTLVNTDPITNAIDELIEERFRQWERDRERRIVKSGTAHNLREVAAVLRLDARHLEDENVVLGQTSRNLIAWRIRMLLALAGEDF
jgi:F420-dependent methylenetetrahydromethanopterin dehydrogenase